MPSFSEKVAAAFEDIERLKAGWRPSEDDLTHAVHLGDWWPILHRELMLPSLAGQAHHPRLGSDLITTSPVLWIDDRLTIARCLSRWYRLGAPRETGMLVRLTQWDQVEELRREVEIVLAMRARRHGTEGE